MQIVIEGRDLPRGDDVFVGVQVGKDVIDLVPNSASTARWTVDVTVVVTEDGDLDVRGKAVHGRRGDRFLYLSWGRRSESGALDMFRRAKLMLGAVDQETLRAAERGGGLVASLSLTAADGSPVCAAVRPPAVSWSVHG